VKREKNLSTTVPEPFHFHNPKPTASMRRYLDSQNQMINPTLKKRARSAVTLHSPKRDEKEKPAVTHKFSSYVDKRRSEMESKKQAEQEKLQGEIQRFIKQTRLSQRVKCSPALVSTTAELNKRKKQLNKKRTNERLALEKAWADQIELINFNIANKPLLVEQVSKAFMRNLAQIRELQKYVKILQESGINPDAHLTEE
jgi:hypothetical protein